MNDSLSYESDKEIDYFKYGNDILNDSNLSDEEKENIIKDSYYQLNCNLELVNSIILINDIEKDDYENIYNKRKLKINYDCINLTKSLLFNESINSNNIHKFIPNDIHSLKKVPNLYERFMKIPQGYNINDEDAYIKKFKTFLNLFPNLITPLIQDLFQNKDENELIIKKTVDTDYYFRFYGMNKYNENLLKDILSNNSYNYDYYVVINNIYNKKKHTDIKNQDFFAAFFNDKINPDNFEDTNGFDDLYYVLYDLVKMKSPLLTNYDFQITCNYFYDICLENIKGNETDYLLIDYVITVLNNDKLIVKCDAKNKSDLENFKKYLDMDMLNTLHKNALENNDNYMVEHYEKYINMRRNEDSTNTKRVNKPRRMY